MVDETPVFLMSPPRQDWALRGKANFRSEVAMQVDADQARVEWAMLADAILDAGGEVIVLPPNPRTNLTGLIYTAEAGEFYRGRHSEPRFILPNMSVEHRRSEADWIGGFMEGLDISTTSITATWEAQGDAIRAQDGEKVIHTFGSGKYKRTEARAYEEVADLLSEDHIQIHFKADPWFHGNTFMNVYYGEDLPMRIDGGPRIPQVVMVCPDALLPGEMDRLRNYLEESDFIAINREESENYDTNSLQVKNTVICSHTLSETARRIFDKLGLTIVELDLSELFSKGGGAPVCLTNRLWGAHPDEFPDYVRWSVRGTIEAHTDA